MKTLITGGTGFVGLNITEELLRRGDTVIAVGDRPMPEYARQVLKGVGGELVEANCDVADRDAVQALFERTRPDRVIHGAVITAGEDREFREFGRVVDVNLKGTANVLQSALSIGVGKVVYVSSGSAYGDTLFAGAELTEDSPPVPDSLYSITKHASERVCARFRRTRGLNVACVRLGSVFGPWERDTGVRDTLSLPMQIVQRAMRGEDIVFPSREPRRDWVYSRDVAGGLAAALEMPSFRHEIYCLSSGSAWTGVAADWCAHLRGIMPVLQARAARAEEVPNVVFFGERDRSVMSIRRLVTEAGFQPRFPQRAACADYAAWIKDHLAYVRTTPAGAA
ncbi:MAG: NAD-dependent epimerase/dehydratase family protein [Burkholderiales bacterium]